MQRSLTVTKIVLACAVRSSDTTQEHRDRPAHGLAFFLAGKNEYHFSDGKILTVVPNDLIYLPKGSSYTVKIMEPCTCYAINFDLAEPLKTPAFVARTKSTWEYQASFQLAENAWRKKIPGFDTKCRSELYHILFHLQNEYRTGYADSAKLEMIRPAVDVIRNSYTDQLLNISELASLCNMTPEYFRILFRKFYGTSPIRYINHLKLTHAKELLESGMCSVQDAAMMSGYTDLCHFSREFKKVTGVSPREYLKKNRTV